MRICQRYKGDDGKIHECRYRVDKNSLFRAEHNGPVHTISGFKRRDAKLEYAPPMLSKGRTYKVRIALEAPWLVFINEVETSMSL